MNVDEIVVDIRALAQTYQGDAIAVLGLLRAVESLHREIRDGIFQECLPENRQQLYALLKDIEAQGGWPYIPRMRVRGLLNKLAEESLHQQEATASPPPTEE